MTVVVFWFPRLPASDARVKEQGRIVDHGCGREPFFERCRVNKGLEAGARLPPGLRDMVELVLLEIKSPHQRADGAIAWVKRDKSALDFRQLGNFPSVLRRLGDANQRTAPDLDVGPCLVR